VVSIFRRTGGRFFSAKNEPKKRTRLLRDLLFTSGGGEMGTSFPVKDLERRFSTRNKSSLGKFGGELGEENSCLLRKRKRF